VQAAGGAGGRAGERGETGGGGGGAGNERAPGPEGGPAMGVGGSDWLLLSRIEGAAARPVKAYGCSWLRNKKRHTGLTLPAAKSTGPAENREGVAAHQREGRFRSAAIADRSSGGGAGRRCRSPGTRWYDWTGHKPSTGFSDLAPSILHYNWF
jgi:hypothetical protein